MSRWKRKAIESFAFLENRTIENEKNAWHLYINKFEDFKDKT